MRFLDPPDINANVHMSKWEAWHPPTKHASGRAGGRPGMQVEGLANNMSVEGYLPLGTSQRNLLSLRSWHFQSCMPESRLFHTRYIQSLPLPLLPLFLFQLKKVAAWPEFMSIQVPSVAWSEAPTRAVCLLLGTVSSTKAMIKSYSSWFPISAR